MINVGACK